MSTPPGSNPLQASSQFGQPFGRDLRCFDVGGAYLAVREGLNLLGSFEDIIQTGAAQAQGAAVAVLLSESADIYWVQATQNNISHI